MSRPSFPPRGFLPLVWLLLVPLWAGCSSGSGEKSFVDLPNVHQIAGEDWFEAKLRGKPEGTGWVQLPRPVKHAPYVSIVDPFVKGFVRPEVCGKCHEEIYQSCLQTAHFRTAAEATQEVVLGSFEEGKNELKTRDPKLRLKLLADDKGLRQQVLLQHGDKLYTQDVPMDISTGSGNHGQTYLFWNGDELYQAHVSYFSELDAWVNSPGMYADGTADFGRGIGERCLDCHATYFELAPGSFNRYNRSNYILGVTCVRCHGPGWAHVQYHTHHPDDHEARYIINPARLPVERSNEVCAQCHSGVGQLLKPAFTYVPGEPLEGYLTLDLSGENPDNDDPHAANQLARLMKSRCFTEGKDLTCYKCHDPHHHERGDMTLYARRCAQCHQTEDCGLFEEFGDELTERCIPCHMASRRDAQGTIESASGNFLPLLRDHYIQARPVATETIVEEIKAQLRQQKPGSQ